VSTSPLGDSGFTFGGLRPRSNSISIDGLDNTDETTGSSLVALSPEIVREFQIVNNGTSAEFGGSAGGAINVITKTGSNEFHGTTFTFFQNENLNAQPFVGVAGRPIFRRYQPGASFGGPLVRDKLFFYFAAEQEHSIADEQSGIDALARTRINTALTAGFAPRLTVRYINGSPFRTGADETEAAGKLTYLINSFNTFNVRFAFTNNRRRSDAFNTDNLTDLSARGSAYTKDFQTTGSVTSVIAQTVINDLRVQLARRQFLSHAGDPMGPGIEIVGLVRLGRPYDADGNRRETREQVVDTVSYIRGKQEFKTGGSINHVSLESNFSNSFGGIYSFRTVDDFLASRPAFWRQAFGSTNTEFGVTSFGAFIQDRWQLSPQLTLNLGSRYDVENLPTPFSTDKNNVSPRLGIAWSPSKEWVVRAGFGLFFDRMPLAFLNSAIQKNGAQAFEQVAYDATAGQIFTANGGGKALGPVATISHSIYRADSGLKTPYSVQTFAGVERLIAADTTIRAELLFTRGVNLPRTRNINLLPPVILTAANAPSLGFPNPTPQQIGRPVFGPGRVDPGYDGIYQLEDSAQSTYRGLSVAVNKRFSSEIAALASYTLSRATDDASDFNEQSQNPFDLRSERAPSLQDVRQRLVLSGVFELPFGDAEETANGGKDSLLTEVFSNIEIAPIITFSSGRPVNPLTGSD
ncbi:MAG: TonB-dependent receptor, partial [Acidobacteriota bacterium]